MNHRERTLAVLNYEDYDQLPLVHFGFWPETLAKWAAEGHLTEAEAAGWGDGNPADAAITLKLGFDFNWLSVMNVNAHLWPPFERKVIAELPDGSRQIMNEEGVVVLEKPGAHSIPAEIAPYTQGARELGRALSSPPPIHR